MYLYINIKYIYKIKILNIFISIFILILKVKEWKSIYHVWTNQNKARMMVSVSEKVDFKTGKYQGWNGTSR